MGTATKPTPPPDPPRRGKALFMASVFSLREAVPRNAPRREVSVAEHPPHLNGFGVALAAPPTIDDALPARFADSQPDRRRSVPFLGRIRAWMLVPPVDFALMVAPLAWRPAHAHAVVAMAVLGTALLTGGGRYRARLHLSVLDELPTILTR